MDGKFIQKAIGEFTQKASGEFLKPVSGRISKWAFLLACAALPLALFGCGEAHGDPAQEAPPPQNIVQGVDVTDFAVDHPEQYPIVAATRYMAPSQMAVTGTVLPDIARSVPVVTLASGRVVDIRARLGDTVQKGQLLLQIRSDDVGLGYDAYRKAVSDELLARKQLDRTKDLYQHGAAALQDVEVAQDAEDDAKTTLDTSTEHLKLLGNDPDRAPSGTVDLVAPISGVITDQEVTLASAVQSYSAPNPFTISDLTTVWIVCDVYENDMANVRLDEPADINLNAFPGRTFKGKVSNIGSLLDPNIRTAKVRIEVPNPGMIMRPGMFATATLYSPDKKLYTAVPSSAILHLHDRDWVLIPQQGKFRRTQVTSGAQLPNNMQEVVSGLKPGDRVVSNAVVMQNAIDNE